jgi:hypothetical protein
MGKWNRKDPDYCQPPNAVYIFTIIYHVFVNTIKM